MTERLTKLNNRQLKINPTKTETGVGAHHPLKEVFMKLLVQADDYGMTPAVADGIIYGIRHGIVRNTGLFSNMPWAEECVEKIRPYLSEISFGLDLNLCTGPSLLGKKGVPSMCHDDGYFYTSGENRAMDNAYNGFDHSIYEEVYKEFDAQIYRFQELTGTLPEYLHSHSYVTKTIYKVSMDLAAKYHIPYSKEVRRNPAVITPMHTWYLDHASADEQLSCSLKNYLLKDEDHLLQEEYVYLVTHCGYVDQTLVDLSTFTTCRITDLDALISREIQNWVDDNHVELITYRELKREVPSILRVSVL